MFRVPRNTDHIMKNGLPHIISQSEREVNRTKRLIRETIEAHPLDFVTQIYEKCVATILSDIRTRG